MTTQTAPAETNGFVFTHTMLRVKDPALSVDFYQRVFGMQVLEKIDMPAGQFTLYYIGRVDGSPPPEDPGERRAWLYSRQGVLELTHNWGTEHDPDASYHNGNDAPQGYGHICFSVPDLDAAIAWMDNNNVTFQKRPEEGNMKHIAFVRDPDDYWIEIVGRPN